MSALTHLLTPAADLRHVTVACGTATPERATWLLAQVTCARCKATRPPGSGSRAGPVARYGTGPCPCLPTIRSEKDLQEEIRQIALAGKWLYYHTHDARKSPSGFPDTVCVRLDPAGAGARLVFAELKMPGEAPTDAQTKWLTTLGRVTTVETFVWYPADLARALEVLR